MIDINYKREVLKVLYDYRNIEKVIDNLNDHQVDKYYDDTIAKYNIKLDDLKLIKKLRDNILYKELF